MKLPLAYYGDPVLRRKTTPIEKIDDSIRQLVADMDETREAHNGVGLAAPQVHKSISLFITCVPRYDKEKDEVIPGVLKVFINPKIIDYSQELWGLDQGCLSIPGVYGKVYRPAKVTIEATDLEGKTFVETYAYYDAQAAMHENDHINGVLFIDRLTLKERKDFETKLREIKKKYHSR